jgi:geranylgeranyl diphosphate synthase, type II
VLVSDQFLHMLDDFRALALQEIDKTFKKKQYASQFLQKVLSEYPSRSGKGIRPALCLSTCGAAGGNISDSINSAAALELFHNAFLVKDDIEDESVFRRNDKTIVAKYGSSVAINVGDALSVLAIDLLIRNVEKIGVHQALNIVNEVKHMALKSVEGQAIELQWVRENEWNLRKSDYYDMCTRKTCWYTSASPCRIGAIIGNPDISEENLDSVTRFGFNLGLGFQIQDDILNLVGDPSEYGKEINGDLLEGKRTLLLIILYNASTQAEKQRIKRIYSVRRKHRKSEDVSYIRHLIDKYDCIKKSSVISKSFAVRAVKIIQSECDWMVNTSLKEFLKDLAIYVVERNK